MTNTTTETELDRIFAAGKAVEGDFGVTSQGPTENPFGHKYGCCTSPEGYGICSVCGARENTAEAAARCPGTIVITLKGDLVSGRIVRQNLLADFECRACAWWAKRPGGFTFTRSDVTAYPDKCNRDIPGAEALEHLYAHLHVRCPRCGALVTMPPADKWPVAQASTICVRCDHEPHIGRCGICPDCTEFPCSSHHTRACQCVGEFPVETTPSGVRVG